MEHVRKLKRKERAQVGKDYKWISLEDMPFTLPCGQSGVVPRGFVCDGCSGPGIDHIGEEEWLVHDWLYATEGMLQLIDGKLEGGPVSRKEADDVFGWSLWHRWVAVRLFADSHWGRDRKEYDGRGPDPIGDRVRADLLDQE